MFQKILKFTKSTYFTNALKATLACVLPLLIFSYFDNFNLGLTVAMGAFLTYPSDVPSSLKNKLYGLLVTAMIIAFVNLLLNILAPFAPAFYFTLLFLVFLLSMISVYGQRASMISFAGLLSCAITFSSISTGIEMYYHSVLLLLGGFIYIAISIVFYFINPYRYTELQIASCMQLTSNYLKFRGDLWDVDSDRKVIIEKQLHLQVELNTIQENIRKLLSNTQYNSTTSNENRKTLIVFISLVEILELSLSTAFDHKTFHLKFDNHPKVLQTYQSIAYELAQTLEEIADSLIHQNEYTSKHDLEKKLTDFHNTIEVYKDSIDVNLIEGAIMLTTMHEYASKQVEKIETIENALDLKKLNKAWANRAQNLNKIVLENYLTWKTLRDNFSFNSTIFRHSLRLTLSTLIAILIVYLFPKLDINIILLTIIVILRPGFGTTKKRSYERTIGTLVGAVIAFCMLLFDPNIVFKSISAIILMFLGFSFTQINYKISATFVTIYVILVYSIYIPDVINLIEFRIIDTLIGASITILANSLFWPSWEYLKTPIHIEKSIKANRTYIEEISLVYSTKTVITSSYRIARKNAFVELGNLMASYQRMNQEPASKQKLIPEVFQLAMLNHTFLSSAASMGTYIQTHTTTAASTIFKTAIQLISANLEQSIVLLNDESGENIQDISIETINQSIRDIKTIRISEMDQKKPQEEEDLTLQIQEIQLITEQLIWLINLSQNIYTTTKKLMITTQNLEKN